MTPRIVTDSTSATSLKGHLRSKSRARRETLVDVQTADSGLRRNGDPIIDLQIEMLAIDTLRPANRRVKKSTPAQQARVTASILRFGLVAPILIDANGAVIHGHAVVDAARALDLGKVPCVRLEHLSADEVRLLSITLNRLAETGEWNVEALTLEFRELVLMDEPLTVTGFDEPIIDGLLIDDDEDLGGGEPPLPALGPDAVSRTGDIWQLGDHFLACGDARDEDLLRRLLGSELARLGFVDPPYNVAIQGHVSSKDHREFAMASGEMSDEAFRAFLTDAFRILSQCLTPGGLLLSYMDWRGLHSMTSAALSLGLEQLNLIVWAKTNAGMGSLWRSQHELIGAYKKPGAAHTNNVELGRSGRWRSNLWRYPGASSLGSQARDGLDDHPTPKPVAMLVDGILDVTTRGDIVVDTFSGSGSTLIACERTDRRFRGVELDPLYVDLAVRRWEAETGGAATLTTTGETFQEVSQLGRTTSEPETITTKPRVRVAAGSAERRG